MKLARREILKAGSMVAALGAFAPRQAWAIEPQLVSDITMPLPLIPPERGARLLEQAWRFHAGDIVTPKPLTHRGSYDATKAGNALGAAATNFDDGDWRTVDLPHDWAIEQPPVATENLAQGYRARGYAWYRRSFRLDEGQKGRYLELQIGAIATNATIWFNGVEVAHNWSGYNAISIDLTTSAVFGDALNTIAIRVDAQRIEGWWYEGAGPYRHVWLVDRSPVHIVTDGVHADPRQSDDGRWRVPVEATLYSIEQKDARVSVTAELLDAGGHVVATQGVEIQVRPLSRSIARFELNGFDPALWSVDSPTLYRVRTIVRRDGVAIDELVTPCGFRSCRFDPDRGFFLNGQHLKIKGVCLHQDHAGVGAAVPDSLIFWRVGQLKAMGCNAIRSAHNAPSSALLDACDALGVLVLNENRLFNVHPDYIEQLEWLVRRDRNRPSVILWSVFNEEPSEGTAMGYEMVRRMASVVKRLDDGRPVTAAMSGGFFTPVNVSQAVDVVGFNYQQADYDRFHKDHPNLAIFSSEDTSAFMTRGEWRTNNAARIKSSDDTEHAVWGSSHRTAWKEIDTRPFVAGAFVWTGFDYHGEPTPYDWPANTSCFGILDLCGFPKSAFYIRRAQWIKDRPVIHILPHWNWQPGDQVKVMVATNLERIELWLNDEIVGSSKVDPYDMVTFTVPFAAGRLEAFGFRGDKLVAKIAVETAGKPVSLKLTPSRSKIIGDGADALPITIEALDSHGRTVPNADMKVDLVVANGRLIGVGNGNPTSLASGKESHVSLFNGLAQAIVQTDRGSAGRLSIEARAGGLRSAKARLDIVAGAVPTVVPGPLRYGVKGWRQSPIYPILGETPPTSASNDMNSWAAVTPGEAPPFSPKAGFVTFAATTQLPARLTQAGGLLAFERINSKGSVWLNGKRAADIAAASGPIEVRIPAGIRDLDIAVELQSTPGQRTGLPGVVFVQTEPEPAPDR